MKRLTFLAGMLVSVGAFALQPADVQITADPKTTVNVLPRKVEQPIMTITVNPADTVHVNGVQKYPLHMHGGVQGIRHDAMPVASFDGMGFQPGIDTLALSTGGTLPPAADPADWEHDGAVRTFCKPSHMSNDDSIVYPGQPGMAHDHTFFRPGTDAYLTDQNIRAQGAKSTCRGGRLDLTARWVPTMYDTVTMQAIVPHGLLMYYKTGNCSYSIPCSGTAQLLSPSPSNIQWVPEHLHMIAGDPTATAPTGVATYACLDIAAGTARVQGDTIPLCKNDGSEALWAQIKFPNCWDGKNLDSPDHKSHMAYSIGWPDYTSPTPGKAYKCPDSHPVQITQIDFKEIFEIKPGMDTSKWNVSCGSQYCLHADWFDGWQHKDGDPNAVDVMVQTSAECLAKRRDCGTFQIYTGQTALEFQGN